MEYIKSYQDELLTIENIHEGVPYTYGNRIRAHFGSDLLKDIALNLSLDSDSRHAYISLWDNTSDLKAPDSPCLVSLFFRKIDDKIHLTATFRSHNCTNAWPLNCFGLYKLMEEAVNIANMNPAKTEPFTLSTGTLTVVSLSLTLNMDNLDQVKDIIEQVEKAPYEMADDPNGYFQISTDPEKKEIVVFHYAQTSELLKEYRGKTAYDLSKQLYKDLALSDLGHAMYIGTQLERAWRALEIGEDYIQDKTKPKANK
jgi:thymidylate synthase